MFSIVQKTTCIGYGHSTCRECGHRWLHKLKVGGVIGGCSHARFILDGKDDGNTTPNSQPPPQWPVNMFTWFIMDGKVMATHLTAPHLDVLGGPGAQLVQDVAAVLEGQVQAVGAQRQLVVLLTHLTHRGLVTREKGGVGDGGRGKQLVFRSMHWRQHWVGWCRGGWGGRMCVCGVGGG